MKWLFRLFGLVTLAGVLLVGILAALLFTGSPQTCAADITPSSAASAALLAQWAKFKQGQTTITLTDAQVTSFGADYMKANDVPVDGLQVHFCPGGTPEASGSIKVLGLTVKAVAQGRLNLSGTQPQIEVVSVKVGNLPSAVTKSAVNSILDSGDLRSPDLGVRLTDIKYGDGQVSITGTP